MRILNKIKKHGWGGSPVHNLVMLPLSDIRVYVKRKWWFRRKLKETKDYNIKDTTLILNKPPRGKSKLQIFYKQAT